MLTNVRKAIGQYIGGELAYSELADLLPPPREFVPEATLITDSDQPVLLESFNAHALAVINDDNRGILVVQIGGKDNLDGLRTGVEGIDHKFFNGLVRAGVQAFRKKLDNPIAKTDVNLVRRAANRNKSGFVGHRRAHFRVCSEILDSIVLYQNNPDGTNEAVCRARASRRCGPLVEPS